MDVFAVLKNSIEPAHSEVMEQSWSKRLLASDYTLDEYGILLQKNHAFYSSLEALLFPVAEDVYEPARLKTGLLKEDLNYFNLFSEPTFEKICRTPFFNDVPSVLGVCYVLEGATLGGQMIAKSLKKVLSLDGSHGLRFFEGYGSQTGLMWTQFKSESQKHIRTEKDLEIMVKAAADTFHCIKEWME